MTSSVTAPLERQFGEMPGLNQMSSQSSAGASVITLQFNLDLQPRHRRAGSAGGDQRGRQPAAVRPAGAADLRQGQSGRRADPDAGAHLQDAAADRRSRISADTRLAQKISQLAGVGLVSISGGQRPAVRVRANPRALAAYGLNIDDLRTTHRQRQRQHAEGQFRRAGAGLHASTPTTSCTSADDYRDAVIAYKNGAPVRLSDVATVVDGAENTKLGGLDEHARRRSSSTCSASRAPT